MPVHIIGRSVTDLRTCALLVTAILLVAGGTAWGAALPISDEFRTMADWTVVDRGSGVQAECKNGLMHIYDRPPHPGMIYQKTTFVMGPTDFRIRVKSPGSNFSFCIANALANPLDERLNWTGHPKDGLAVDMSFRDGGQTSLYKYAGGLEQEGDPFGAADTRDMWHTVQVKVRDTFVEVTRDGQLVGRTTWSVPMNQECRLWMSASYGDSHLNWLRAESQPMLVEPFRWRHHQWAEFPVGDGQMEVSAGTMKLWDAPSDPGEAYWTDTFRLETYNIKMRVRSTDTLDSGVSEAAGGWVCLGIAEVESTPAEENRGPNANPNNGLQLDMAFHSDPEPTWNAYRFEDGTSVEMSQHPYSGTWDEWHTVTVQVRKTLVRVYCDSDLVGTVPFSISGDVERRLWLGTTSGHTEVNWIKVIPRTYPAGTSGTLALTGLSSAPTAAGAQLTFSLSADAAVDARVLNLAGRPVGTICRNRPCAAGLTSLVWNAMSDRGLRAPNGAYLIEVGARGAEGQQVRQVTTVQLRR